MTDTLTAHRLAALVPEMAPDEYEALKADIAAHGLLEPIVLYQGQILDGRNRHRGCLDTGTEPRFTPSTTHAVRIQRIDRRQSSWRHAPDTQSSQSSSTR